MPTKFNRNHPSQKEPEYEYVSVAFFGKDKNELIEALNKAQLPYSSISHFVRAAINSKLEAHDIDFHITER